MKVLKAEIISVGTELLMGELVDTNSVFIASELAPLGIELRKTCSVGDNIEDLSGAIQAAFQKSEIVITTGGLGPTSDDITRESIAHFCQENIHTDEFVLNDLHAYFTSRSTRMPEINVKQAGVIPSSVSLSNSLGSAPGWWVNKNGKIIIALPGPPTELITMWNNVVADKLQELGSRRHILKRNLKTHGLSEGQLNEMLAHLFGKDDPYLGIYSKQDGIHLRIVSKADSREIAQQRIDSMEQEIRNFLIDNIWGVDDETPEQIATTTLLKSGETIAVAEGFTSGLLASHLRECDGWEDIFRGGLIYPKASTPHSNSYQQQLVDKSNTIRGDFQSSIGISVSHSISGSTGSGNMQEIMFAYSTEKRTYVTTAQYHSNTIRMRERASTYTFVELLKFLRSMTS